MSTRIIKDGKNSIVVEKDGDKFTLDDKWYVDEYKHGETCQFCGDKGARVSMLHQNCTPSRTLTETEHKRKKWDSVSAKTAKHVFARDGFVCCSCGSTDIDDLTIDHVIPISKGGSNELDNLKVMCKKCNSKKGNRAR